jgi:hypothetical protein
MRIGLPKKGLTGASTKHCHRSRGIACKDASIVCGHWGAALQAKLTGAV